MTSTPSATPPGPATLAPNAVIVQAEVQAEVDRGTPPAHLPQHAPTTPAP